MDPVADRFSVEAQVDGEGLTEFAGATTEVLSFLCCSTLLHNLDSVNRFESSDENSSGVILVGSEIQAMVHAVDKIDVDMTESVVHDSGTFGAVVTV